MDDSRPCRQEERSRSRLDERWSQYSGRRLMDDDVEDCGNTRKKKISPTTRWEQKNWFNQCCNPEIRRISRRERIKKPTCHKNRKRKDETVEPNSDSGWMEPATGIFFYRYYIMIMILAWEIINSEERKRTTRRDRADDDKNATPLETTMDVHCRSWRLLNLFGALRPTLFLEQCLTACCGRKYGEGQKWR